MIRKLKIFAKAELIKTFFLSSLSTTFKIGTGLVLNKVIASYIGPVGIALVGQFNNFFGLTTNIGGGGIDAGVVKYIAEHRKDDSITCKIISTAFLATLVCSVITGIVLLSFAGYFSELLFNTREYKFIIIFTALFLVITSLKSLLIDLLNGYREVTKYTWVSIITNLSSLTLSIILVMKYNLNGILTALVACQFLGFLIVLFFSMKSYWFKITYFFSYFDKAVLKNLSKYSAMTLVYSFSVPFALLVIRNYIGVHLSWREAGYLSGIWTISDGYLMLITSLLSIYYLPRLSEITDKRELRSEIINTSKIIIPLVSIIAFFIYLIRVPVINILFTDEFKPMLPLFKYQLLGDVIKISSWMISFQMLAKAMTGLFIISEILLNLSLVILSVVFIHYFGLRGAPMAFCLNCFLYLLFMLFVFRNTLFVKE